MATVFLACKAEEEYRELKHIICVFDYLLRALQQLSYRPLSSFSEEYYAFRENCLQLEMLFLREIGFHVRIEKPFGILASFLKVMDLVEGNKEFCQRALNYLNDCFYLGFPLYFASNIIACTCIYRASNFVIAIDQHEFPWLQVFNCTFERKFLFFYCRNLGL